MEDEIGGSCVFVPLLLSSLRKRLYEKDGCSEQGIFRLSGQETLAKKIVNQKLNEEGDLSGEDLDSADAHTITTLIKRWYMKLPVKIFEVIPKETLLECLSEPIKEEDFTSITESLRSYEDLFLWLMLVLLDVLR